MPAIPSTSFGRASHSVETTLSSEEKLSQLTERTVLANSGDDDFAKHRERIFGKKSPMHFATMYLKNEHDSQQHAHFFTHLRSYPFAFNEKKEIAKEYPYAVSRHLHQFFFDSQEEKIEFLRYLIHALNEKSIEVSLRRLCDKIGFNDQDKVELLIELAKYTPHVCIDSIHDFPELTQSSRVSIAKVVAEHSPKLFMESVSGFEIESKNTLKELFVCYFNHFIQTVFQEIENSCLDVEERDELIEGIAKESFLYIRHISSDDSPPPDFRKHTEQLGIRLSVIADMFDEASHLTDSELRDSLQMWAIYAHIRFSIQPFSDSLKQDLSTSLTAIYRYRQPGKRLKITRLLASVIEQDSQGAHSTYWFEEVCRALLRPHTWIFRSLLCAFAREEPAAKNFIERYATLLSRDELKDKKRQHNIVNGLLTLLNAKHLSPEQKQTVLQALTPVEINKREVKSFARNMQNLADFIPLTKKQRTQEKATEELLNIKSGDDLYHAFGRLFLLILGRTVNGEVDDADAIRFTDRIREVTRDFRRPNALLTYCSRIYTKRGIDNDKDEIFKTINQFIDNVLLKGSLYTSTFPDNQWVDNISDAYRDEKNNIAESKHLVMAERINKEATRLFLHSEKEIKNVTAHYGAIEPDIDIREMLYQHLILHSSKAENEFPIIFHILNENLSIDYAEQKIKNLQSKISLLEKNILPLLKRNESLKSQQEAILTLIQSESLQKEYPDLVAALQELKLSLLLNNSVEQKGREWTLKFTHDVENHLLCSTEVNGSCLALDEGVYYNRALMGIVIQGKNRIITLHSADNTIQARCIIRLGIDKKANQLALQIEDAYINTAAPINTDKIFGEFAREFAGRLGGLPVFTHSISYGPYKLCSRAISFDQDRAWVEYVDSGRKGIVSSREGFSIEGLFQLK